MQRNLYLTLGVARTESPSGIRAAFRDLVKRYHPDRTGPGGAATFREITEAYAVLSDPARRARHDEVLDEARLRARAEERQPRSHIVRIRDADVRPGLEPLFARIARNFTGLGVPKGERVEKLDIDVRLTREEAERGTIVNVGAPMFQRCEACAGLGRTLLLQCASCLGAGLVEGTRRVPIHVPPGVSDGVEILVPLARAGVHNLFASVRVTIDPPG
jgi:molecular chaperone DnaJ